MQEVPVLILECVSCEPLHNAAILWFSIELQPPFVWPQSTNTINLKGSITKSLICMNRFPGSFFVVSFGFPGFVFAEVY